mmetsp:Transcript_5492/g.6386  ORF Transcript_5492/g.6386 Transcript_5492/m.6386 type:complete len:335 (+) Transcript_5492:389-1393(+)|eukprot:CAMPEP_0184031564 /NCGR_PEP_ID=MMETSP0955-20130417/2341_1 /TAXON_ID=627963 /ORGANISM="Aplanochytrium sp, Strain PBS07" /LENGTH=334 /DNA_ID=CAMNT_0026317353 /DNA_START=339 /DNA_END=1343 /DNA_ORIENTATION=-
MIRSGVMRAMIFRQYGNPKDVLHLVTDQKIPEPKANEVLVKTETCSINAADRIMVRANYFIIRLLLGLFKPAKSNSILGMDVAGTIHAIGKNVENFRIGDSVVADISQSYGGGFAEYTIVKSSELVRLPPGVSFEDAATVPISGQAAMMGIDVCAINSGDKVLINGASGGVGSFGVKLAKAQGAHVTAICSPEKADTVKSWGADEVLDYTKVALVDLAPHTYDAVFDTACFQHPTVFARAMKDDGKYVLLGGSFYNMLRVKLFGQWYGRSSQKFQALPDRNNAVANITKVLEMIADGSIKPAIQNTIPLDEVPNAINSLEQRTVVGKIVVHNQL